jgi:hypothetical protein
MFLIVHTPVLDFILDAVSRWHAASICDNTPEAICRVLEEEEEFRCR